MQCFLQGLVFFLVVGILWYLFMTKHVWGLGARVEDKKKAIVSSLGFALIATAIFMVLNMLFF